jgi:hypothetical protein
MTNANVCMSPLDIQNVYIAKCLYMWKKAYTLCKYKAQGL